MESPEVNLVGDDYDHDLTICVMYAGCQCDTHHSVLLTEL